MTTLQIDCAAVLTLWGSVVAERLGWPHDTALTLGRAVAGTITHAKDVRLGLYAQPESRPQHEPLPEPLTGEADEIREVPLLGRIVHVAPTAEGARAISENAVVQPASVERYLQGKFGNQFCAVWTAMERLADAKSVESLFDDALRLYEEFRPMVPSDESGYGVIGILDLDRIHALARTKR